MIGESIGMPDPIAREPSLIKDLLGDIGHPLDHIHVPPGSCDAEAQKERFLKEQLILLWHLCVWDFTEDFGINECEKLVNNLVSGDDFEDSVLGRESEPVHILYGITFSEYWQLLERILEVEYVNELEKDEVEMIGRLAGVSEEDHLCDGLSDSGEYTIDYLSQRFLRRCSVVAYDHGRLKFEYDSLVRFIKSGILVDNSNLAGWINKALGCIRPLRISVIAAYDMNVVLGGIGQIKRS